MKSFLHFGMALLYLLINLGITTSIHYCGNKITEVSILSENTARCACDSFGKMNCCHDTHVEVKFEQPSTLLAKLIVDKIAFIDLFFSPTSSFNNSNVFNTQNLVEYISDHPSQQIQHIKTSVLRI